MTGRPPTAQLLILVDRAERGPLTAAEAGRLRAGIGHLVRSRAVTGERLGCQVRRGRDAEARLRAVAALADSADRRDARTVPLFDLNLALHAEIKTTGKAFERAPAAPMSRKAAPGKPLKAPLAPERANQVIR